MTINAVWFSPPNLIYVAYVGMHRNYSVYANYIRFKTFLLNEFKSYIFGHYVFQSTLSFF
jgi:hypothetical protein